MAPEDACFVGCCGNDTAWAIAADEDGFATEFRVIALFDGCEEGVHVDVEDGAGRCHKGVYGDWCGRMRLVFLIRCVNIEECEMNESEQLIEAWNTNCKINRMIIDSVSNEGWLCTLSKRGGRGVAGEFAHMHNVRLSHLVKRAKDLSVGVPKLNPSDQPSKAVVLEAFDASDRAIGELFVGIHGQVPKRRGFKKGLFTTLSYFVSHEAHHRGRILLTLKVSGETLDRTVQMQIWGWDQL